MIKKLDFKYGTQQARNDCNITKNYFNQSNGFILLYDNTDKDSLEHLNFWIAQIQLNAPEKSKYVLLGNK